MTDALVWRVIAEIADANETSLRIVVSAICKQIDPARLANDLQAALAEAEARQTSTLAIDQARSALVAARSAQVVTAPIERRRPACG